MPRTEPLTPIAILLYDDARKRFLTQVRELLEDPSVAARDKREALQSTRSALDQIGALCLPVSV